MAAPMDNDVKENKTSHVESTQADLKTKDELPVNGYAYILGTASISLLLGFGGAFYTARRRDATLLRKVVHQDPVIDEGPIIATKALGCATVISLTSCGLLVFGVFKLLGVNNFTEFSVKLRDFFPKKESVGRSDFKTLKDLGDYLETRASEEDTEKVKKTSSTDKS